MLCHRLNQFQVTGSIVPSLEIDNLYMDTGPRSQILVVRSSARSR